VPRCITGNHQLDSDTPLPFEACAYTGTCCLFLITDWLAALPGVPVSSLARSLARKANQGIGVLDGGGPGPNESLIALA
jgi:hypothetical protein